MLENQCSFYIVNLQNISVNFGQTVSDDDLDTKVRRQLNESDTYFSANESSSSSSSSDR